MAEGEDYMALFNLFLLEMEEECEETVLMCDDDSSLATAALVASSSVASEASGTSVKEYFEGTIPSYSPSEFASHFRMSREAVQVRSSTVCCEIWTSVSTRILAYVTMTIHAVSNGNGR